MIFFCDFQTSWTAFDRSECILRFTFYSGPNCQGVVLYSKCIFSHITFKGSLYLLEMNDCAMGDGYKERDEDERAAAKRRKRKCSSILLLASLLATALFVPLMSKTWRCCLSLNHPQATVIRLTHSHNLTNKELNKFSASFNFSKDHLSSRKKLGKRDGGAAARRKGQKSWVTREKYSIKDQWSGKHLC